MSLFEEYLLAEKKTREISYSYFFSCLSEIVKFIDLDQFSKNEIVDSYKSELKIMLKKKDFGLTSRYINEFSQKMGEVHFYCLCLEKNIFLERIEETKDKSTPDFKYLDGENIFYFEVKTPSVIGGDKAIDDDIEIGFKLKHHLTCNQCNRPRTASIEHKPYGLMIEKYGHIRGAIRALSDKIRQNYKQKQFSEKNTFMVVNLSMIHNLITEPEELNPVYSSRRDRYTIISGVFWMMAFRKIGMAVFGIPFQTNGFKHGIDGYCEQNGVLIDLEQIEGLLLVTNPPQVKSEIWGLFRERILNKQADMETLIKFTDYRFNDELNTRGMCNNKYNNDYSYNTKV